MYRFMLLYFQYAGQNRERKFDGTGRRQRGRMTHAEIRDTLQKLGLSRNQSSVYMVLVARQELRVQEIAERTRIPRTSVYESLKGLRDFGLVEEIVDESFKKYRPYPIASLRHGLDEKIVLCRQRMALVDGLESQLELLADAGTAAVTKVRYYKDVSGARQLMWNSLKATNIVYVYSAWGRRHFVGDKFYRNFVSASRERGIRERVITNPKEEVLKLMRSDYGTPASRTKFEDIRVLDAGGIEIKGETFIYNDIYAQVYLRNDVMSGFEIQGTEFVESQRAIFEMLWNKAKPVKPLL